MTGKLLEAVDFDRGTASAYETLKEAIPINAKAQVTLEDFDRIKQTLASAGHGFARTRPLLRVARQAVEHAMAKIPDPHACDVAFGAVEYLGIMFIFIPTERAATIRAHYHL